MDAKERVMKTFQKITDPTTEINTSLIARFLGELYSLVHDDVFVIADHEEFTVKRVDGTTFFDSQSRILYLGSLENTKNVILIDTLITMMQFYHFRMQQMLLEENGEIVQDEFKQNAEKKLALEYVALAIANYLLDDYYWPGTELQEILKEYGLIDNLLLIQYFSKKFLPMVEYAGDFKRLMEKIRDTLAIFSEIHGNTSEDDEMLDTIDEYVTKHDDVAVEEFDESEREEFLLSLLNSLTIRE